MTILIFISCHKIISLLFITTFPLIQRNKLSKVWGLRRKLNKKQTANNFSISNHAKHFDFRRCSLSPTASVKSNFQQHPRRLIKIPLLISFMIANSSLPFIMQNRGIYAAGVYDRPYEKFRDCWIRPVFSIRAYIYRCLVKLGSGKLPTNFWHFVVHDVFRNGEISSLPSRFNAIFNMREFICFKPSLDEVIHTQKSKLKLQVEFIL